MSYLSDEDLQEVIHFADHFLLEAGVHRGKQPDVYGSPHKLGGTSVDFVPGTNTLVFRGADEQNLFEVEEDTVKLLAKIYAGIRDDYSWDSGAYLKLETSLEVFPDTWELPFRDSQLDTEVNEYVLGSELWKRRSENLIPLIEGTEERVQKLQERYDEKVEPVELLDRHLTPEEKDYFDQEVYEYFNSDVKNQFIENIKQGDRGSFRKYTQDRRDEIYFFSDEEEKADELLDEVDENLDELEEISKALSEEERNLVEGIMYEVETMLEQKEPRPEEKAVAYMVPLLVHGRIQSTDLEEENLRYIREISENSQEVLEYARDIYREFTETDDSLKSQERFLEAIENSGIEY